MKFFKQTIAVLLSAIMLLGALPITAMAETETGRLGDSNVYYELTDEGVLRLYGTGATPNYPAEPETSPFYPFVDYIEKVVVEQGITRLGNYLFAECALIEEVSLPKSLLSVGNVAFGGCSNLKEITFDSKTESFGFAALYGCRSLKSVTFKANRFNCFGLYSTGQNSLLGSVKDATIYVNLPMTVEETQDGVSTTVSSYEEAVAKFGQNNNTVCCVNDNAEIKWKNYDGTVLETDENATQGEIPTYNGATPTKPSDDANVYYFTGWTPQPFAVMGDMSYTATFGSYGKSAYLDQNGEEQEVFARPLTGTETLLSPGWYIVNKNINYSHTLYFTDEVHLILADGKKLTFSNGCDFSLADPSKVDVDSTYEPSHTNLNFYWQSGKTGTLTMNGTIATWRLNVYGGNITSKVFGYGSTFYDGNLTFKDEAQCSYLNVYGGSIKMESCDASVQFNVYGGNFQCTGTVSTNAPAYVTLGYTKPSDSIYIGYLYLEGNKNNDVNQHVKIKDGQKMADAADRSTVFEGVLPLSSDLITVSDINGKTLVPYAHNSITYVSGEHGAVTGASEADYGDEITLTVTPDEDYALDELTVTTSDNTPVEVVDNKFIMPADAVTVTAYFVSTKRYTVKWVVDGEVVETDENLRFGETPQYNGETPYIAPTEQYYYTFEGWSPAITPVSGDATYTAQFSITLYSYTVNWVVNGRTVETDENVFYGMMPEYNGATPEKVSDKYYTYTFAGWTPEVTAVTGDVTYTATFTKTAKPFRISVKRMTGGTTELDSVTGDTTVAAIKERMAIETGIPAAEQRLIFAGKELADEKTLEEYNIEKESTLHLVLKTYTITWMNGGEVLAADSVAYGETPEYSGETPTKADDEDYTYTFAGWTPEVVAVTGDAVYTAQFTAHKKANDIYNLTVQENIDVNVLVDVNGHAANGEIIDYIEYTYPDVTTQAKKTVTETVEAADIAADENGYFAKSFTMAIAQANEPINATVYFTNGTTKDITVSVANYCKYIIDNAEANGYSDKLVNLCYAVLDYGKNAADYFKYEYAAYPEYTLPPYFDAEPDITSQAAISKGSVVTGIASTQMFILSKAMMRLTFKDDISGLSVSSIKVDGDETDRIRAEITESNGQYSVDISGIYATELSKPIILELSDGTKVRYSATDWARSILAYNTDAKSKALARSLYYYSKAANYYFA